MKTIIRNDNEESLMVFVIPYEESETDSLEVKYKYNIEDDWNTATVNSFSIDCCGYVIMASVDTEEMKDGSMFVKLESTGVQSAIEEYILLTEKTESVSNYNGVKITNG